MLIDGVEVTFEGFVPFPNELQNYVDYCRKRVETPIKKIHVKLCDDGLVDVSYQAYGEKFERIRRVTGYLVGTLDRWNDAKRAEERDRVKHVGGVT